MTYEKKLRLLNKRSKKELSRYSNYIKSGIGNAKIIIDDLSVEIAKLDFEDFDLELTPSNAIRYDLQFANKIGMFITRPFHHLEDVPDNCVIYTIFENHNIISNGNYSDIRGIIHIIKYYINVVIKKEIEFGKTKRFKYNIYGL